ncbi:mannosyl-3-phosphoglycerate synthase [Coniella lustricola]|uniref:Mannosyl-3-phosphoglycerate synthase n=1 Tax=Coniella lustricola TaxID=2025994 RepID=A0A2T2ZU26_9PEZI|nr:mannosyl-3-phosphoglycerate synthase [Coniella lustricola]
MRLTAPASTTHVGRVEIRGLQRIVELDTLGTSTGPVRLPRTPHDPLTPDAQGHQSPVIATESVSSQDLYKIQSRTAIVVPCKDESLDNMQGVWAAVPASSLLIVVSASDPETYACERDALRAFCQQTGRNALCIHQGDPKVARAVTAAGMAEFVDQDGNGLVHKGKGEAMAVGIALAATAHNMGNVPVYYKYIGFVDADNLVPGSVQEYCRAFSAGLFLAQAQDSMVRISWASKPKIHNGQLEFKKSGRSSEIVNRWLNKLLSELDAKVETVAGDNATDTHTGQLICTGNAGEHAMTISLALKLRVANGYAIEPFHFLDMIERFAGQAREAASPALTPPISPVPIMTETGTTMQILQIRTINPHFHADKGEEHVAKMWKHGLSAIYHSPLTESAALSQFREELRRTISGHEDLDESSKLPTSKDLLAEQAVDVKTDLWQPERCRIYQPLASANLFKLRKDLETEEGSFWFSGMKHVGTGLAL